MNKLLSCRYNMDTNRVEARFEDGTTLAIDCIAVEDEYGNTPAQRAELDWLLYNKPLEYAQMVLRGEMKQYGILRAIGMDDAQLKRMISAEAGTYAVSGLVVGIALGLVLNRKLYILLITHYFGAAWQMPWGCLAVIVVVVLAAVVLAVYNPVRRILMQPITATISEL